MTRARGWYYQPRAAEDAEAIIAHFVLSGDGPGLARRFISSLETSLDRLLEQPEAGPLCGYDLHRLHDVRLWAIRSFPAYLVYYREFGDRIEIIRIVHGSRDLPTVLRGSRNRP